MFKHGDRVEFLMFGILWSTGRVYAVLPDKIVIYAPDRIGGMDLYECKPEDVRKVE